NFFVDLTNIARAKHMKPMIAHGYDAAKGEGYNFDVFLDYIAHGFEMDRLNTDSHWRLQVDNIAWSDVRFDFVGRVENYDADIRHVFAAGGAPAFPPPALLAARHNRSAAAKTAITPEQRIRIRQLYAPDYEAFGY
ncbi:MAG: sulfotransferase family 2 domain-containing protein, partial [Paracoccaceae bacterium]